MFLTVDYAKCNRDGLCVLECPAKIIEMNDKGPVGIEGAEEICIKCGHCVAICPEEALSLNFLSPESCRAIDESFSIHNYFGIRQLANLESGKVLLIPSPELDQTLPLLFYV